MAWRETGNVPQASTAVSLSADPSSGTLLAEVYPILDEGYEVRYIIGASTNCIWRLQQCLSSGLGSTAVVDQTVVFTPANQSAQYIINYARLAGGAYNSSAARFRIIASTALTAQIAVKIVAEPLV